MVRFVFALFFSVLLAGSVFTGPATAQQSVWVQIEAQRTLTSAQDSARGYSAAGVNDVSGYALPGGWYGVVLGPYAPNDAETVLRTLRRSGAIPSDSYRARTRTHSNA